MSLFEKAAKYKHLSSSTYESTPLDLALYSSENERNVEYFREEDLPSLTLNAPDSSFSCSSDVSHLPDSEANPSPSVQGLQIDALMSDSSPEQPGIETVDSSMSELLVPLSKLPTADGSEVVTGAAKLQVNTRGVRLTPIAARFKGKPAVSLCSSHKIRNIFK